MLATSRVSTTFIMQDKSFLSKYQVNLPNAITAMGTKHTTVNLSEQYQVGPNDVVCGRGKGSYNRPGNKKFRALVQQHVEEYVQAKSKLDKSMVLSSIVEKVREQNKGRFVKQQKGCWFEIGDELAREKVGHAIREAIAAGEKKPVPNSSSSSSSSSSSHRHYAAAAAGAASMMPSAASAKAAENPEVIQSDFRTKHSNLLSQQVSYFEGLVKRTDSPVDNNNNNNNSSNAATGDDSQPPPSLKLVSDFQW